MNAVSAMSITEGVRSQDAYWVWYADGCLPLGMLTNACHAQVTNCYAELSTAHGQRSKTCGFHVEASAVVQAGQLVRYCHLCNTMHPLEEFDGGSRC